MPAPGKPPGKILLRHMRGAIDVGLENSSAYTHDIGDIGHVTCIDGDIDTQDLAEFVVEKMAAMGWTFTKQKRK